MTHFFVPSFLWHTFFTLSSLPSSIKQPQDFSFLLLIQKILLGQWSCLYPFFFCFLFVLHFYHILVFLIFIDKKFSVKNYLVGLFGSDTKYFLLFFCCYKFDRSVFSHTFTKNWIIHQLEKIFRKLIFCFFLSSVFLPIYGFYSLKITLVIYFTTP